DFSLRDAPGMSGVISEGLTDGGIYYRYVQPPGDLTRMDNIVLRGFEAVELTGTAKADILVGTYGDDRIIGADGDDTVDGFFGGSNYLDGGEGNDILKGGDPAFGAGGDDKMIGGRGEAAVPPG